MLQAKTKEQKERIEEMLDGACVWFDEHGDGIHIDDWVSYDNLAQLVDYLRSINKSKKKELDFSIVSDEMKEVVETWLAYKKEKGQSYKPIGFKTFYKKLCEMSGNNPQIAMLIVEQSMQNNYAGLYPLKQQTNNGYARPTNNELFNETIKRGNEFSKMLHDRINNQTNVDDGDSSKIW